MSKPIIGEIFSSDSDEDDHVKRIQKKPPVHLNINRWNAASSPVYDSEGQHVRRKSAEQTNPSSTELEEDYCPDGYVPMEIKDANRIKVNTLIIYKTVAGKTVKPKYFKKVDAIANAIHVGIFSNNRRNYSESLSELQNLYVQKSASSENELKETIEIPRDQWKTIRRDMIISYEKKQDNELVRRARFNSFLKGSDGASRMSMTSERGFNYVANPDNIEKIYRHITSQDKTTTLILEAMRKLDSRVQVIESIIKKHIRTVNGSSNKIA